MISIENFLIITIVIIVIYAIFVVLCKYVLCKKGVCNLIEPETAGESSSRNFITPPSRYLEQSLNRNASPNSGYPNATLDNTCDNYYFSRHGLSVPNRNNVDASTNTPSSGLSSVYISSNEMNNSQRRIYNVTMEVIGDELSVRYGILTPNRDSSRTSSSYNAGATNGNNVRSSSERHISAPNGNRAPSANDANISFDERAWRAYAESEFSLNDAVSSLTNNTRERPPDYSDVVVTDLTGENTFPEVAPQIPEASPPKYDSITFKSTV